MAEPTLDKLSFTLSSDGTYYTVKASSASISGEVVIPSEYNEKPVKEIGNNAFNECLSLTSVTIPDSVISIGNYAFYGCSALTSVTIGNGVTSIGNYTFGSCLALTSIIIPDSVTSIEGYAFSYCSSLKNVIIKGKPTVSSNSFNNTDNTTSNLEKIYVIEGKGYTSTDTIDSKPVEIITEARALELEREWFPSSSPFIAYIGTTPITAIYLGSTNITNIL